MFCPVCASHNKQTNLILYQINFTTAVYLCEDKNCSYPKGHKWIEVERTLNELDKKDANLKDLDNWLHNLLNNGESKENKKIDDSIDTDKLLTEIFGELENMCESGGNLDSNVFQDDLFDFPPIENGNKTKVDEENSDTGDELIRNQQCDNNKNSNIENKLEPEKECTEHVENPQVSLSNQDISSNNTYIILNGSNSTNTNKMQNKKTKVIVNKGDSNITHEQVLEILKKLPPSNGKTIVLNLGVTKNPKFKGIVFQSKIIKTQNV